MDCMVLAGFAGDEQNYGMSRIGQHDDFDTANTDAGAPVEGNLAIESKVGQPITALMPGRDRQLVFGCDHSLWRMIGHPRQGGSVVQISDKMGIIGPNAWTSDPAGNLYFVSTAGFHAMSPGGGPLDLSSVKVPRFFRSIDRAQHRVTCCWDTKWQGCHIFVTHQQLAPYEGGPVNVHLFYSVPRKGFFRIQTAVVMDPTCAVGFDGDSDDQRLVMMGCRDGVVRVFDDSAVTDDGVAISSYALLGPVSPAGRIRQARATGVDLVLGELPQSQPQLTEDDNWHVDWEVRGGDSAYEAAFDPAESRSGSFDTAGSQRPQGFKMSAAETVLKVSNATLSKFWSLDEAAVRFVGAGKVR
jgi:hypothetical protein